MAKRPVFEEVSAKMATDAQVLQPGLIDRGQQGARGPIRIWLAILFALVMAMIIVGGMTRLTAGGLFITEW